MCTFSNLSVADNKDMAPRKDYEDYLKFVAEANSAEFNTLMSDDAEEKPLVWEDEDSSRKAPPLRSLQYCNAA